MSEEPAAIEVSVIVPHYADRAGLDRCLAALERQTYPRDRYEIIVADNASPEGEAAVAETVAGRARLTVVTLRGPGPARNGGVTISRGQILAFTDCDCIPEPTWLEAGIAALRDVDVVGGAMEVLVENPAAITPEEAFEVVFAFDNRTYVEKKGFTVSANLFCSRKTFEMAGGFSVSQISEDLEWCRRAVSKGLRLGYAPEAVVGHPARATWADLIKKWRRMNREVFNDQVRMKTFGMRGQLVWLLRALVLPATAVAHTPKALFARRALRARDRLGAVTVLYRLRFWRLADNLRLLRGKA